MGHIYKRTWKDKPGVIRQSDIWWVTESVDEHYYGISTAKVDPIFDPIRDDPRFHDLLRRMNLEP